MAVLVQQIDDSLYMDNEGNIYMMGTMAESHKQVLIRLDIGLVYETFAIVS